MTGAHFIALLHTIVILTAAGHAHADVIFLENNSYTRHVASLVDLDSGERRELDYSFVPAGPPVLEAQYPDFFNDGLLELPDARLNVSGFTTSFITPFAGDADFRIYGAADIRNTLDVYGGNFDASVQSSSVVDLVFELTQDYSYELSNSFDPNTFPPAFGILAIGENSTAGMELIDVATGKTLQQLHLVNDRASYLYRGALPVGTYQLRLYSSTDLSYTGGYATGFLGLDYTAAAFVENSTDTFTLAAADPVPLPAGVYLFVSGLLALAAAARRRYF